MDIWHSAAPDKEVVTSGWLGRYFDNTCPGCDPHAGVSIGETLPLAMRGERVLPLSFDRPENYRYAGRDHERYLALNQADPSTTQPSAPAPAKKRIEISPHSQLDFLHRTAMDAQVSSDEILRVTRGYSSSTQYPGNEFGNGLRTVAAMIGGGLPTRVYYVSLGGFDTHANESRATTSSCASWLPASARSGRT
jgi:uncharacterized protein (DUF1501 family)